LTTTTLASRLNLAFDRNKGVTKELVVKETLRGTNDGHMGVHGGRLCWLDTQLSDAPKGASTSGVHEYIARAQETFGGHLLDRGIVASS
jgi:hypothetical protein